MTEGTVKWFNESKGFGFLSQEGGPDVFVHHTEIRTEGYRGLNVILTAMEAAKVGRFKKITV